MNDGYLMWAESRHLVHRAIKDTVDPDVRFILRLGVWNRVRRTDTLAVRTGVGREIESDD